VDSLTGLPGKLFGLALCGALVCTAGGCVEEDPVDEEPRLDGGSLRE
jgi:hypothetical protein